MKFTIEILRVNGAAKGVLLHRAKVEAASPKSAKSKAAHVIHAWQHGGANGVAVLNHHGEELYRWTEEGRRPERISTQWPTAQRALGSAAGADGGLERVPHLYTTKWAGGVTRFQTICPNTGRRSPGAASSIVLPFQCWLSGRTNLLIGKLCRKGENSTAAQMATPGFSLASQPMVLPSSFTSRPPLLVVGSRPSNWANFCDAETVPNSRHGYG